MRGYQTIKLKKPVKTKCSSCNGRGKLDKDYSIFDCPYCDGAGRVTITERAVEVKPLGKTRHTIVLTYVEDRHSGDNIKKRGQDMLSEIVDTIWRVGRKPTCAKVTSKFR